MFTSILLLSVYLEEHYKNYLALYQVLSLTSRLLFFLCFLFVAYLWVTMIKKLILKKKEKMSKQCLSLSCMNYAIITWVFFVSCLYFLHTVLQLFMGALELFYTDGF